MSESAGSVEASGSRSAPQRKRRLRATIARTFLKGAFASLVFSKRLYQPVRFGASRVAGKREFEARWDAISRVIREYKVCSLLDIGCAEGSIVRNAAAEHRCFAIGIDAADRMLIGAIASLHDEAQGMALVRQHLDADGIYRLPVFDMILCLSVLHHNIRKSGLAAAEDFLRAIASRTGKVVVFEVGTSDEHAFNWSAQLPDMPDGQQAYVESLLERCGLTNMKVIASTERYEGANRLLVTAEPSRA